jgi:hypothetical protein
MPTAATVAATIAAIRQLTFISVLPDDLAE